MAVNFLDVIANKEFAFTKTNGYDPDDVDSFLDEVIGEMEKREAATLALEAKVAELTEALKNAASAPVAAQAKPAAEKHATESFELVLSKAKGAYEEIVAAADARAEEIVAAANAEAGKIRTDAQTQIADLTAKLADLRSQTSSYYAALKKIVDAQTVSMDQLKKLL